MMKQTECPFCKTRRLLHQALEIIDQIPEIGAEFYDAPITDLANEIDNAISTFRCYCNERVNELPETLQEQIREFPR